MDVDLVAMARGRLSTFNALRDGRLSIKGPARRVAGRGCYGCRWWGLGVGWCRYDCCWDGYKSWNNDTATRHPMIWDLDGSSISQPEGLNPMQESGTSPCSWSDQKRGIRDLKLISLCCKCRSRQWLRLTLVNNMNTPLITFDRVHRSCFAVPFLSCHLPNADFHEINPTENSYHQKALLYD